MRKSYLEIYLDIYRKFYNEVREDDKIILELFDKVIVWLISLSTGFIVLIFSLKDKIDVTNTTVIRYTLIALVCSVLCGLIGRVFSVISKYLSRSLASILSFQMGLISFPHKPRSLEGTETAELIYEIMIDDFKVEVPIILEQKKKANPQDYLKADKHARDIYEEYCAWSEKEWRNTIADTDEMLEKAFGYREGHFKRLRNKKRNNRVEGILMRLTSRMSDFLYVISTLAFCFATCYFVINIINGNI